MISLPGDGRAGAEDCAVDGGPVAPAAHWGVRDGAGVADDQDVGLAWGMVPFGHSYEYPNWYSRILTMRIFSILVKLVF